MIRYYIFYILFFTVYITGCTKVDYTVIQEPAYLRVFNSMNYELSLDNKDGVFPYFCMFINPDFDAAGIPIGGEIVGDFLDKRDRYAPPYPSHIGNSNSVHNPEYPGKENVLVGPILNGFDLSSWAQVPSGSIRVLFMYRPKNTTPFFQLEDRLKRQVLLDTVINLQASEVYTLHLLQKDFNTRETGMLLRQENFHKLPLSNDKAYVNFYNYSAKGFWEADLSQKPGASYSRGEFKTLADGIRDEMNVYMTLFREEEGKPITSSTQLTGYRQLFLMHLKRSLADPQVATYHSFPLWADTSSDGIRTTLWQRFELLAAGLNIHNNPYSTAGGYPVTYANYASFNCFAAGLDYIGGTSYLSNGTSLPNLLVNVHSGKNNPQTFATVSSIEIINNYVYLTTIQRKYPAPMY